MATTTETTAAVSAPVPVELPEVSRFLNESQWEVLMSLMDAIIPSVLMQDSAGDPKAARDPSTVRLPSSEYSETAAKLRKAVAPLDPSSDILESYLGERPSESPAFAQILTLILSNLSPNKQREFRILLSLLK